MLKRDNTQLMLGQVPLHVPQQFHMSQDSTLTTHPSRARGPLSSILTFPSRVLVVLDDPCQAEVGNLTHQGRGDQDVGSPEVSVNVVPLLDEGHAFRNLHPKQRHPHPQIWPSPRWVPQNAEQECPSVRKEKNVCASSPFFVEVS